MTGTHPKAAVIPQPMKITKLHIHRWRHFRDLTLETGQNDTVCLVGENGTGKTALLELLLAAAGRFGLTGTYRGERANPLSEPGCFDVWLWLNPSDIRGFVQERFPDERQSFERWDGVIQLHYTSDKHGNHNDVTAPDGTLNFNIANAIIGNLVVASGRPRFLHLDANRSYSALTINDNILAERMRKRAGNDVEELNIWKEQGAARSTDLYREWEMTEVGREGQLALEYLQRAKDAVAAGQPHPPPEDRFADYGQQLSLALPHLRFAGARVESPMGLLYSSADTKLRLCELSGGEREIAFILGQLMRFNLKDGLLVIDEPELHLNPDLVRSWITTIKSLMREGQLWIATHSMEAVEAAGADNTFALIRSDDNRTVHQAFRLADNEVYATLSNALGTPGFSVQRLKFVYVEGNSDSRESQRFIELCQMSAAARYIDAGNCREVARKVLAVRELAEAAQQPLRVGGVIDRDFRGASELGRYYAEGIFVLDCHEVENLYLHPGSLGELVRRAGTTKEPTEVIREIADEQAGHWVLYKALFDINYQGDTSRALRMAANQPWSEIELDLESFVSKVAALLDDKAGDQGVEALRNAAALYAEIRGDNNLWLHCRGKEVMSQVAQALLGVTADRLRQTLHVFWRDNPAQVPEQLSALRAFVERL